MENSKFKIIYEDDDVLVIDKPAGIIVFSEKPPKEKTLIDYVLEVKPELKNVGEPPRYGIVHRLDKDTSGILLVAKNEKSLIFLQKQFKDKRVEKKYIALVVGSSKNNQGIIETFIGRNPREKKKQKVFLFGEPGSQNQRKAVTKYKTLERFENFSLVEIQPKTGRKHQIRCHFSYLGHPIAGDKLYGFKNQACPEGLNRHFLHASYIKIQLANGKTKEFTSGLPDDLKKVIDNLMNNKQ